MKGTPVRKWTLLFVFMIFARISMLLACAQDLAGLNRKLPKPLPNHPGNVFLAGEEVAVPLPGDWTGVWRVLDYDGRQVAEGNGLGEIALGQLPVGYYEILREDGKPPIGIGVLAPLAKPTPKTSPIGVDTSAPWSLGNKLPEAASLCALAGINWARGRLNWMQMEPQQGKFALPDNYDVMAREFSKAGIQVLQVNHHAPPWAGDKSNRFPDDLRDSYQTIYSNNKEKNAKQKHNLHGRRAGAGDLNRHPRSGGGQADPRTLLRQQFDRPAQIRLL